MAITQTKREFIQFHSRQDRPRFMTQRFADVLRGRILDVGCDRAVLREFVGSERYTGVDRSEEADIKHDLQNGGPLPFEDSSFDVVVCTDVLEHLDNLHQVFDEIVRVGTKKLLISLPNNWNAARHRIERGHGTFKHYGLPLDPPVDRHRWFFSFDEARDFFVGQAERHNLKIGELVVLEKPRFGPINFFRRLRYPKLNRYLNRYTHTLVCVYEYE
ncbi:MAG: SAM-dependent methyltransferase [Planctomycetota bacterium]|jgi:SAM-dependent methyltransferase